MQHPNSRNFVENWHFKFHFFSRDRATREVTAALATLCVLDRIIRFIDHFSSFIGEQLLSGPF